MALADHTNLRRHLGLPFAAAVTGAALGMATADLSAAAPAASTAPAGPGSGTDTQMRPIEGFLLHQGRYVTIDVPAKLRNIAPQGLGPIGINDREAIVGSYGDNRGMVHGFLLEGARQVHPVHQHRRPRRPWNAG
jgi:hypothetical protein